MTEATLDPKGLEAAAREYADRVWMAGEAHPLLPEDYDVARATVLAYLAAIENPAPVEED